MEVHAKVDEADIGRIRLGQRASFTVESYPGRVFNGTVVQIRKSSEEIQNVVIYTVVIAAENQDLALLPGMTAFATIVVKSDPSVLKVPNAALRFKPPFQIASDGEGAAVVWILQESGKVMPVHISVGNSDATSTELISSGLAEGQRVIVSTVTPSEPPLLGLRIGF